MIDQYTMFNQETLEETTDATSSQESDCGTTLCSLRGGKINPFGLALVPASLIVQQVSKEVKQTIGTYGLNGCASSKSVALQFYTESKLQMLFPSGGLTMFIKGWKRKTTPLGRLYCQLAVSVRPTSEIDCGLWATPNTMDHLPPRSKEAMDRQFNTTRKGRTAPANVREQVIPALWPTPKASDHKNTGDLSKSQFRKDGKERNDTLGRVAYGSTVQTGNKGSLNPQFPCWLMGMSKEWVLSMQRGMALYHKLPQDSYKPLCESK